MRILVWDDNRSRAEQNRIALINGAGTRALSLQIDLWSEPTQPTDTDNIGTDYDLYLLHDSNREAAEQWLVGKKTTGKRILRYGGDGVADGIPRPVSTVSPLTVYEAAGILEAAERMTSPDAFAIAVRAIWREHVVAQMALRLLCEAWLLNQGAPTVRHNQITVNAPVIPEQWFAPFAGADTANSQPNETSAVEISIRMGTARPLAELFFRRLLKLRNQDARKALVEWDGFESDVRQLRDALHAGGE